MNYVVCELHVNKAILKYKQKVHFAKTKNLRLQLNWICENKNSEETASTSRVPPHQPCNIFNGVPSHGYFLCSMPSRLELRFGDFSAENGVRLQPKTLVLEL